MLDPKERFYRQFQASQTRIQEQISELPNPAVAAERQDAIEHILASISNLSREVADASDFIPAYDQRNYTEIIKTLQENLRRERAKGAPKTRFQFKHRPAQSSPSDATKDTRRDVPVDATSAGPPNKVTAEAGDTVSGRPILGGGKNYNDEITRAQGVRKPSFSAARDITLSGHRNIHIILPSSASRATSSGTLTELHGCIIDMSAPTGRQGAPFANLTLKNISNSLIIAGHVEGSVHITGVKNSILVFMARQVRIHECESVDLYLHCMSHPIIEDCSNLRFATAPECYLSDEDKTKLNMWDQVNDFKWLKAEPSPNWRLMTERELLPQDMWKTVVQGLPGDGPGDILRQVGLDPHR
ncbi:hypothetical protein OQA88_9848 [Cercophora sp. LCS_1]